MIKFTIRRSIGTCKPRLNEIKRRISSILILAQADFTLVNIIFQKYANVKLSREMATRLSEGIKFLQYMDTLTQKLNHIASINQSLIETHEAESFPERLIDDDPAEFIFRLNYFQAFVANNEFLSTVSLLKEIMTELSKGRPLHKINSYSEQAVFRNLKKTITHLDFILFTLQAIYSERHSENRNDICPASALMEIKKIYTMNSERLVLEWLQSHPADDTDDLMRIYARSGFGREEQQAEIF